MSNDDTNSPQIPNNPLSAAQLQRFQQWDQEDQAAFEAVERDMLKIKEECLELQLMADKVERKRKKVHAKLANFEKIKNKMDRERQEDIIRDQAYLRRIDSNAKLIAKFKLKNQRKFNQIFTSEDIRELNKFRTEFEEIINKRLSLTTSLE